MGDARLRTDYNQLVPEMMEWNDGEGIDIVLREIYQAKLAWQFPSRRFEVFFDESDQEDLIDYEVTFFQVFP